MALDKPNQRLMSLYIPHEEKGTLRSVLVVDQNFLLGDGSLNQDSNGELIENTSFNTGCFFLTRWHLHENCSEFD